MIDWTPVVDVPYLSVGVMYVNETDNNKGISDACEKSFCSS